MNILKKKFYFPDTKPNVPKNDKIKMGWFTANNMVLLKKYLRNVCTKKSIVIEFGTWLGMSAKFICDNISDDSTLICVDWWKGDTSIGFITQEKEDLLYHRYIANVWNYRKKIIPVRMDGKKAAVYLSKLKIKPNLIYLDMGHSYEDVIADLNYEEDSTCETDMNIVMTGDGRFVEVQGTGEEATYSSEELDALISSGKTAIEQLFAVQKSTLSE